MFCDTEFKSKTDPSMHINTAGPDKVQEIQMQNVRQRHSNKCPREKESSRMAIQTEP